MLAPMRSRYDAYLDELGREIPGFRVVRKDTSRLHRAIDRALRIVTFGRMTSYLVSFQTTIGRTVYVTADWDERDADARYVTMRHEAVHLRQFRRYTLPGMALFYVLLPLPMGLAYFRMRLERSAYAETIRASAEVFGVDYAAGRELRDHVIGAFVGPAYGWMWPFRRSLERWYDRVVRELDAYPNGVVR
jgi:hypothetical protein